MAERSIIESLKTRFPDLIYETAYPEYITSLYPDSKSIRGIHCYKPLNWPCNNDSYVHTTEADDTEVTGTPLEAQFETLNLSMGVDRTFVDDSLLRRGPIDNSVAGQILNYCSLHLKQDAEISVLCNGHFPRKVVTGFYKGEGILRQWWIDLLKELPNPEEIMNQHRHEAGKSSMVKALVQWSSETKIVGGSVKLILERNELVLSPPRDHLTSACLQITIRPGARPSLKTIWKQLELLRIVVDLVHQQEQCEDLKANWCPVLGLAGRNEMEEQARIRHFLGRTSRPAQFRRTSNTDIIDDVIAFASTHLGSVDYSWLLLAESDGTSELRRRVGVLFSAAAAARREGRPIAVGDTESKATAALAGTLPGFTTTPIEILAELGGLKLRRELTEALSALAGPGLPPPPPITAHKDLLLWLYRAASTLELLAAMESLVKEEFLTHVATRTLISQLTGPSSMVLTPWKSGDSPSITVSLPVPINQLSEGSSYLQKTILFKLTSSMSSRTITTTFLSSNKNLMPPASLGIECRDKTIVNNSFSNQSWGCLKMTLKNTPTPGPLNLAQKVSILLLESLVIRKQCISF